METHSIPKGEGGRHDTTLVPLVNMIQVAHWGMRDGEHFMAFLDDVYMATDPDGVGLVYATVQDCGKRQALGSTWGKQRKRTRRAFDLERVA